MNTVTHWIIVGCAFIAAVVLTAFGYRRLRKTSPNLPDFSKRCSLFAVALCCFVALLTTNASGDPKTGTNTDTSPTASTSDTKLPAAITSPKNWEQFRTLWWELIGKYDTEKKENREYTLTKLNINLSDKQRAEYSAQLCQLLGVRDIPHLQKSIAATTSTLGGAPWDKNSDANRFSIPMLVLGKSSLEMLNNFQQRYAHHMTRMALPASAMLKGTVVDRMITRLVALKQLRREGKLDTKAYSNALNICSRDMWASMFFRDADFRQSPVLLSSEGEIIRIGISGGWYESANNKMQKLKPDEKLFPPMSEQEAQLANERRAAIRKLETKASNFPSAWLRGLNLQILNQRKVVEKISNQQQRIRAQRHLKNSETQFKAMCKIYKARQAVEKFLTKNLGPADGVKDASVKTSAKTGEK